MAYEDRYSELEQYLRVGEPDVKERARNWSIAIGLQAVDGLKPSEYLYEPIFLIRFFRNLLLGEENELKNRFCHIRWERIIANCHWKRFRPNKHPTSTSQTQNKFRNLLVQ